MSDHAGFYDFVHLENLDSVKFYAGLPANGATATLSGKPMCVVKCEDTHGHGVLVFLTEDQLRQLSQQINRYLVFDFAQPECSFQR